MYMYVCMYVAPSYPLVTSENIYRRLAYCIENLRYFGCENKLLLSFIQEKKEEKTEEQDNQNNNGSFSARNIHSIECSRRRCGMPQRCNRRPTDTPLPDLRNSINRKRFEFQRKGGNRSRQGNSTKTGMNRQTNFM